MPPETRVVEIAGVPVHITGDIDGLRVSLNRTVKDPPDVRVELKRMAKGYQWEISVSDPDPDKVMSTIGDIDRALQAQFASDE